MTRVFLSYASEDCTFAELVKLQLESHGIEVWLDQGALKPGNDWKKGIEEGIASSDSLIVVLSPNVTASSYVTFEWAFALGKEKRIIPLLHKEAALHPRLASLHHLDFRNPRRSDWEDLVKELQAGRALLSSKPKNQAASARKPKKVKWPTKEYEVAKALVLDHLSRTGYSRVSFDKVRKVIDPTYTDEFLMEVIRRNRSIFRRALVKGRGPGFATD